MTSPRSPAGSTAAASPATPATNPIAAPDPAPDPDTAPHGLRRDGGPAGLAAAAVVVVQWCSAAAWLIPISGLVLVLFLVLHLAGVSLALLDPTGFEQLAEGLHRQPWLPPLEVALAAALLLHPLLALLRSVSNRQARGAVAGPQRSRRDGGLEAAAALAGRWAPWSGALLMVFLVVHLAQLRLHRPAAGGELEALLAALASPFCLGLYGLAGGAVGLHLLQGHESAHRSLGWLEPANRDRIRWAGRALALFLGAAFSLLPIALVLRGSLAAGTP
jgi:succinate dehydrogenase / fumarate reductase cytochrome b subunit